MVGASSTSNSSNVSRRRACIDDGGVSVMSGESGDGMGSGTGALSVGVAVAVAAAMLDGTTRGVAKARSQIGSVAGVTAGACGAVDGGETEAGSQIGSRAGVAAGACGVFERVVATLAVSQAVVGVAPHQVSKSAVTLSSPGMWWMS